MPVFDTPEPIFARIELVHGTVRMVASDRADTVVDVRPTDPSVDLDVKVAEQTKVSYSHGKLVIKGPKTRGFSVRVGSVDVTVELPTGSNVQADAAMVSFRGEGRFGECKFRTAMGDLDLDHTGDLQIQTAGGQITVDSVVGTADVTAGSGTVRIRSIDGPAILKNTNGRTTIGEVTGEVKAKGANGDLTIDRAHAGVNAKTASGDIRLGEVIRGSIVVEAAVGELEIGIRQGTVAWLDLNSVIGRVESSLEESHAPERSEEKVEVRARSVAGNILVHHA
jgi:DUF4097 and DUF4098 domain-containing protein YvlB